MNTTPPLPRWNHLHLAAPDPRAAADWYAQALGAQRSTFGDFEVATVPGCAITWYGREHSPPSAGSSLDHWGLAVADLHESMIQLIANGASLVGEPRRAGKIEIAFLDDPWGARIELLSGDSPPGFHHVHLYSTDAETARSWWQERFGGEAELYLGLVPGLRFARFWLLFRQAPEPPEPTGGRAIDHLALLVDDTEAALVRLGSSVEVVVQPQDFEGMRIAVVDAWDGVRLELMSR